MTAINPEALERARVVIGRYMTASCRGRGYPAKAAHDLLADEAFLASLPPAASEPASDVAVVERIETVPIDHPFSDEETPPIWRVRVGEHCADFDFEQAARNFARAINAASEPAIPDVERYKRIEREATALVRQLRAVIHRLNGQAYSSTLSQLNALDSALAPKQPGGEK